MDIAEPAVPPAGSPAASSGEIIALKKIRFFSLLSLLGYILETVSVVLALASLASVKALPSLLAGTLSVTLVLLLAGSILLLASFIWLRSGFGILKNISKTFGTPYTGITLYFVGLALVILGMVVLLVSAFHPSAPGTALSIAPGIVIGAVIVVVGGILAFVGTILALIMGSFRLRNHFNVRAFRTVGIMFIVGIFFGLFSVIGVILLYRATGSLIRELSRKTGTFQQP